MSNSSITFPSANVGDTYTYNDATYQYTSTGWVLNISQTSLPQFISGTNIIGGTITNANISNTAAISPSKIDAASFTNIGCVNLTSSTTGTFYNLTVNNVLSSTSTLSANSIVVTNLTVNTGASIAAPVITGGATISNGATINGGLVLNGTSTVNNAITFNGTTTLSQPLIVNNTITGTGAVTFSNTVEHTGTSHFKLPVGTTAERPGTLAAGQIRYNSTLGYPEWFSATTSTWLPFSTGEGSSASSQGALFLGGRTSENGTTVTQSNTQLNMSSTGILASEYTSAMGVAKTHMMGTNFGGNQAIVGWGCTSNSTVYNNTYLISNIGVVGSTATAYGTARRSGAGTPFGTLGTSQKGVIAYGYTASSYSGKFTQQIDNNGVAATETTAAGTGRYLLNGFSYGGDKGMFANGYTLNSSNVVNTVSNVGVISADTSAASANAIRHAASGSLYGLDKAIITYGYDSALISVENLVSNTGVFAADKSILDVQKRYGASCSYASDKNVTYGGHLTTSGQLVHTNLLVLRTNTAVISEVRVTVNTGAAQSSAFCSNFA